MCSGAPSHRRKPADHGHGPQQPRIRFVDEVDDPLAIEKQHSAALRIRRESEIAMPLGEVVEALAAQNSWGRSFGSRSSISNDADARFHAHRA